MFTISGRRVTVRTMAAAILENGGEYLMMHRSPARTLAPGQWSAVGGHLEGDEFDFPTLGCLREIQEETALSPGDIHDLELRHIMLRLRGDEIRFQYIFHGRTGTRRLGTTDEGSLHWLPGEELLSLDMPPSAQAMIRRLLSTNGTVDRGVDVGVITAGESPGSRTYESVWIPLIPLPWNGQGAESLSVGNLVSVSLRGKEHTGTLKGGELKDPGLGALRVMEQTLGSMPAQDRTPSHSIVRTGLRLAGSATIPGDVRIDHTATFTCMESNGTEPLHPESRALTVSVCGPTGVSTATLTDWED